MKISVQVGVGKVTAASRALGLSRSSYYRSGRSSLESRRIRKEVLELSGKHPRYGYRRITALMLRGGSRGFNGITVLKKELTKMVQELNDGTFFNLIFFDDSVDFKPKLVVASSVTKKEAAEFIAPYYSAYSKELLENYSRDNRNWPSATRLRNYSMPVLDARAKYVHDGGAKNSQIDAPLVAAFQMQADTIFIISDGHPTFDRALFDKELKEHERGVAAAEERRSKLAEKERQRMEKSNDESSQNYWKEIDEERQASAPRIATKIFGKAVHQALPSTRAGPDFLLRRRLIYSSTRDGVVRERQKEASKNLHRGLWGDAGGEAFLKALAQEFHGRHKRIRGLAPPEIQG